jgi:putative MATE family efflux protein
VALTPTDRRILRLAVPALGALAAEPLYRLVDTAIVGRIGTEELGGVAIAVSILALVVAGSNFLAYGTTQRVANRLGADDEAAAARVGIHALWLAVVIGAGALPLLFVFADQLVGLMGAGDGVREFAADYLRISALGVPFSLIGLAAQGIQRGASDYRTSLVILVAANVVNVVVELVFVVAWDLGVAGAAWSTVIAQVIAGTALVATSIARVSEAGTARFSWSEAVPLLSAGRHLLLRVLSILAVFTGSTSIAARLDDATLAAHSIVVTMFLFLALTLDALAVPAQTLVAEELGLGGPGANDVAARSLRLSGVVGIGLALLLASGAPLIARGFSNDADVIGRAVAGLVLLAIVLIPGALAFSTDGSLIGAADYRFLGRAALLSLVAVAPIAVIVLANPSWGIVGIWSGLLVWMVLRAGANLVRVRFVLPAKPA